MKYLSLICSILALIISFKFIGFLENSSKSNSTVGNGNCSIKGNQNTINNVYGLNTKYKFEPNLPDKFIDNYLPIIETKEFEMRELKDKLFKNKMLIIDGISGTGKSFLAWYLADNLYRSNDIIPRWISSENKAKIIESYLKMILEFDSAFLKAHSDLAPEVLSKKYFSNIDSKILLLFDDVREYDHVNKYISNLPSNVYVIITTKNKKLHNFYKNSLHYTAELFSDDEAYDFVSKKLRNKTLNDKDKIQLIKNTGRLPLNLQIATTWFDKPSNKFKTLQDYINERGKTSLYEFTFSSIEKENNLAWKVLHYISFLDTSSIDLEILIKLLNVSKNDLSEAIEYLESNSILEYKIIDNKHIAYMHELTRQEIIDYIKIHPEKDMNFSSLSYDIVKFFSNLIPSFGANTNLSDCIHITRDYFGHLIAILDTIEYNDEELKDDIMKIKLSTLYLKSFYYMNLGKFADALKTYNDIVDLDKNALLAMHMKGRIAKIMDNHNEYEKNLFRAYEISKEFLIQNPKSHLPLKIVAFQKFLNKEYKIAIDLLDKDIAYSKSITSLNLKALILFYLGRISESKELLLNIRKKLSDHDINKYAIQGYNSNSENSYVMGLCYLNNGNKDKAYEEFIKAINYDSVNNDANFRIAKLLNEDRRYKESLDYIEKALANNLNNPFYILEKVIILLKLKNYTEATILLQKMKYPITISEYRVYFSGHYVYLYSDEELKELENSYHLLRKLLL